MFKYTFIFLNRYKHILHCDIMLQYDITVFNAVTPEHICSEVLQKINDITKLVASPSYVKTPQFDKLKKRKKAKEEEWKTYSESFKPKIKEVKSESQCNYDMLRAMLNKMTDSNYTESSLQIISFIQEKEVHVNRDLLHIISTNVFYCKPFSKLFSKFISTQIISQDDVLTFFQNVHDSFCNIPSPPSSSAQYNDLCLHNKQNDERKAKFIFILQQPDLHSNIHSLVNQLILNIQKAIKNTETSYIVDELVESFLPYADYFKEECAPEFIEHIEFMSDLSLNSYEGLSNKALFKYMDIQELF